MNWYYANNQDRVGPITEEALVTLISEGRVLGETLVWNESLPEWKRLLEVRPDLLGVTGSGADMEFCAVSGKAYPRSQMLQYEGKWISAEHRDTYFQRLREGVSGPADMSYAGFWIRFLAKFIDVIIIWLLSALKSVVLVLIFFGHANIFQPTTNPAEHLGAFFFFQFLNFITDIAIGVSFSWFFLSKYQATPGKLALDLKVVRADASKLSTGRIIGRYFAEMLSGLILAVGYIMAAFDEPEKRALHDRICDTRVVRVRK